MGIKAQETSEAELLAVAVMAFCDAVNVLAANQDRANRGLSPAYDGLSTDAVTWLDKELHARSIFARATGTEEGD